MARTAVAFGALFLFASLPAPGAEEPLSLPAGARVGHISLMTGDITHHHKGREITGSFLRTYQATWQAGAGIDALLDERLTGIGLTPVRIAPPYVLERYRDRLYLPDSPTGLRDECAEELARIMADESLDAVIVLAPGANNSVNAGGRGNRLRNLPEYVRGWVLSTEDASDQPALLNLAHLMLIEPDGSGVRLHSRDWGGGYSYQWSAFTPPPDLRALPPEVIGKLEPLFREILSRQIDRILENVAVTPAAAPVPG